MNKKNFIVLTIVLGVIWQQGLSQKIDPELWEKAWIIHDTAVVIDTHCDTPMAMLELGIDIGKKQEKTDVDLIRMKQGGVDASFFAVYVSNSLDGKHPAKVALEMIDEIYCQVDTNQELAEKGGVIQINFFSAFLDPDYKQKAEAVRKKIAPQRQKLKQKYRDNQNQYWSAVFELWEKYAPPPPEIDNLIKHIDHVIKLVGINHVGLGSDFDGASSYPTGLDDISGFPLITYHLLRLGYTAEDIAKMRGGNLLRVFKQVETIKGRTI
jgi:microsomal dipeptidase-like Zn-dependent dipeptidase